MIRCLLTVLPVLFAAAAMAEQQPANPVIAPTDSWDKYRVLTERNIFVKNRSHRSEGHGELAGGSGASSETTKDPALEANVDDRSVILTGVVQQGEDWVAFLEDTRTGRTTRARIGHALGDGTVAAIAFSGIEYYRGTARKTVAIGQNLAGLWPALPAASSSTTSPSVSSSSSSSTPPSSSAVTVNLSAPTSGTAAVTTQVQPSSGTSGGADDILERMRRRRAEELKK